MKESFERSVSPESEYKSKFRKLIMKVHGDTFKGDKDDIEMKAKAADFARKINELNSSKLDWKDKLNEIGIYEKKIEEMFNGTNKNDEGVEKVSEEAASEESPEEKALVPYGAENSQDGVGATQEPEAAERDARKDMGGKFGEDMDGENDGKFKMGEEKDPDHNLEEQEKLSKLEELRNLVEEKRKAYAAEDYKTTNLFTKLKGVLGLKSENLPKSAKDSFAYQQYQGVLNELRELQLQSMRDKYANIDNLPPAEKAVAMTEMKKEMGEMAIYFGISEKIDLAGARTDARTIAWSETKIGRFGEKALKRSAELINAYRKLDPKVKTGIAIALFAVGGVAALTGSAGVAAGVAGVSLVRRWISGAALGVGVTAGLEARSRNKANETAEKNRNEIVGNPEENWQQQFQALNEYCGSEMKTFHDSLQKEKSQARNRKLIGASVGLAVGTGAAGWLAREGFGLLKHGAGAAWEHINVGGADETGGLHASAGASPVDHVGSPQVAPHLDHSNASYGDAFHPTEAPVSTHGVYEHVAVKGDNVEKMMIHQKMAEGMSRPDAEKLAHVIASNPDNEETIKQLSKIKPGQKIIVDWEKGTVKVDRILGAHVNAPDVHAAGAPDAHIGASHAEGATMHHPAVEKAIPVDPNNVEQPALEASTQEGVNPSAEPVGGGAHEGVGNDDSPDSNMQAHASADEDRMYQETTNEYNKAFGSYGAEVMRNIQAMPESMQAHQEEFLELGRLKVGAEEAFERALRDPGDITGVRAGDLELARTSYEAAYSKILNGLAVETFAGQEIEGGVAGLKAAGAADFLDSDYGQNDKILELREYVASQYGENFASVKSEDTSAFKWINRMLKATISLGGDDYKNFRIPQGTGK
jgi:hypothetical protein